MRLFLDDERFPPDNGREWVILRSVAEAIAWVEQHGWPCFVAFDNDLGPDAPEGWTFVQWLIDRDLDRGGMPEDFDFWVHSRNPVRQQDIEQRLRRYLAFRSEEQRR